MNKKKSWVLKYHIGFLIGGMLPIALFPWKANQFTAFILLIILWLSWLVFDDFRITNKTRSLIK